MELLSDVGHVESHLFLFGDWCKIGAGFTPNVPSAQKIILDILLGDKAQVNAHFGQFGDSANLDQGLVLGLHRMYHRLGIILDATDGTHR
jgi:hypothetical protein